MPRPYSDSIRHPRNWLTRLTFGLLRALIWLPYPVLMALGRAIGRLVQRRAAKRVAIARTNLQLCFPDMTERQREQLIDANFAAMGMGAIEIGMAWWWPRHRVERHLLAVEGLEHLPTPSDTRGTIFLTAHFTSIELSGRYLGHRTPSHAMYRRNENPVIQSLFERFRTLHTISIIDRNDVRAMLRALKSGEGVWFAPDQNIRYKGGVFADFMGIPAATVTATSRFASMTGARVIPFVLLREPGGYRLVIEPALTDFPSGDAQADAERINDIYARWVRRAPEQYNWIHRRFKTRPPGEPPLY